ncbi:MAG: acylphosphatase [Candidatus Levybacteria bacterium]|nr:acylphosphatase [Candidatus Levybacteria bacterium]
MKTVHVTIHGRVHGVGFRQFVKTNAVKLNLVGWVQNTDEKTVEVMLQGENTAVSKMVEHCNVGPMLAEIRKVDTNEMEETFQFETFEVL